MFKSICYNSGYMKPILNNIRILDFSWVLAGPYATRLLADFGAEVIKVHPLLPEADDRFSRGYYNTWNRNKWSITLDLNKIEGLELAKRLVRMSDAVVENFSPRVMENWGLDYPGLQTLKPDIILLSMSAMGHTGPWRDYTGFGPTVQAFSGITHLTSYPEGPPQGIGYSYADHIAGLYGSLALLGALEYRLKTGKGQYIDLSETETMTSLLSGEIFNYSQTGKEPQPMGNVSLEAAPHGVYRCMGTDRWCAIAVSTEEEWEGLKRALGNPGWAEKDIFQTKTGRIQNSQALDSLVQGWTSKHTDEEIMLRLQKEGVPAGTVQNAADLAQDPQLKDRGFWVKIDTSEQEKTIADASPIHLSDNPSEYRRAAPGPGQDNDYVYGHLLEMSKKEIKRLEQEKII